MAAYAATVSSKMDSAVKIDSVVGIGMYAGAVNITNYNSTLAAITAISKKFKSIIAVVAAPSDAGYVFEWVDASNAFKAYFADYDALADGALIQAADDSDVGEAHFIAIGLI